MSDETQHGAVGADADGVAEWLEPEVTVKGLTATRKVEPLPREHLSLPATGQRTTPFDRTQAALAKLDEFSAEELLEVYIELDSPRVDTSLLAISNRTERKRAIEDLKGLSAQRTDALALKVRGLGGTVLQRLWLGSDALLTALTPEMARTIAGDKTVRYIEIVETTGSNGAEYTLGDARVNSAVRTRVMYDAGFESNTGHGANSTEPVRIGILEHPDGGYVADTHVGYADSAGGASRVLGVYGCNGSGCTLSTSHPQTGGHGNWVTSIALGGILQGQDPAYPGSRTASQENRTGQAPEAEAYYYRALNNAGYRTAVEQAVEDEIDVLNMSFQMDSCDPDSDYSGANAAIAAARGAHVLTVACSGNGGGSLTGACKVRWPGTRPDVVTVGGLRTDDDSKIYTDTDFGADASEVRIGGMPIEVYPSGASNTATVIGLAAPGVQRLSFGQAPASYASDVAGCSFATPTVSGAAANLKDMFEQMGWGYMNANSRYANLVLLGDAWNGQALSGSGTTVRASAPNRRSGFGRLRMRWPHSSGMVSPWWWHWGAYTVSNDEVIAINVNTSAAEPSGISEYKVVLVWFPNDLHSVADVTLSLWDTCAPGGEVLVGQDHSYDYHKRVRLSGASVSGRCLQVRIEGYAVPAGGEKVYLAQLYHGDTAL